MKRLLLLVCVLLDLSLAAQEMDAKVELTERKAPVESYGIYDTDLLTKEFHAERRQALRDMMPMPKSG